MNPGTTHTTEHEAYIDLSPGLTEEEARKAALGAGGITAPYWAVYWNGHEFETVEIKFLHRPDADIPFAHIQPADSDTHEAQMELYYPIDLRTERSDWDRAIKAKANEYNDAWLPDWDNDAMVDYEKELKGAVVNEFQPTIDGLQVKVNESTNATVRATAVSRHLRMVEFRDAVVDEAVKWVRGKYAGWPEQHPHEAHIHQPVLLATQVVAGVWIADRSTDFGLVNSAVSAILKDLGSPHVFETRWGQAARLEAEAKAQEAEESEED